MDYTSFAPGPSSKPNIPNKLPPALPPPHHRHFPKWLSIALMLGLLAAVVYGGLWWWQQMQMYNFGADTTDILIPSTSPQASVSVNAFQDLMPLYNKLAWTSQQTVSMKLSEIDFGGPATVIYGTQVSATFTAGTSKPLQQQALANYYSQKLRALGWQEDVNSEADGPTGSTWGYTKAGQHIFFAADYSKNAVTIFAQSPASQTSMHCGGNILNAPTCPPDYTCQLNVNAPDTGGTCVKNSGSTSFCGGLAGVKCSAGYTCKYLGNYPDASGTCIKQ